MARPIANPITYGTLSGNVPMSDLDTSFNALFTTGFNDSSLGWVNYAADTGTANAYVVTLSVTPSSYVAGMCVAFTPQNSSTGVSTLNVNALGTKSIVNKANLALQGSEIRKSETVTVLYDGTSFRIISVNRLALQSVNPGNLTVSCDGYDEVSVLLNFTSTTGSALTLAHLSAGVSVEVAFNNASASANSVSLNATDENGTAYPTVETYFPASRAGSAPVSLTGGSNITAGAVLLLSGVSTAGGGLLLVS